MRSATRKQKVFSEKLKDLVMAYTSQECKETWVTNLSPIPKLYNCLFAFLRGTVRVFKIDAKLRKAFPKYVCGTSPPQSGTFFPKFGINFKDVYRI